MSTKEKVIGCLVVWKPEKNYGFINVMNDDGSVVSYFLHAVHIYSGAPEKGSIVRFESAKSAKGLLAVYAEIFRNRKEMDLADSLTVLAGSTSGNGVSQ